MRSWQVQGGGSTVVVASAMRAVPRMRRGPPARGMRWGERRKLRRVCCWQVQGGRGRVGDAMPAARRVRGRLVPAGRRRPLRGHLRTLRRRHLQGSAGLVEHKLHRLRRLWPWLLPHTLRWRRAGAMLAVPERRPQGRVSHGGVRCMRGVRTGLCTRATLCMNERVLTRMVLESADCMTRTILHIGVSLCSSPLEREGAVRQSIAVLRCPARVLIACRDIPNPIDTFEACCTRG